MECRNFQSSDSYEFGTEGNQYNPIGLYNDQTKQVHANVTNNGDHQIFDDNFNTFHLASSNGFTNNVQKNYEAVDVLIKQKYSDINERIISSHRISTKSILSSCNVSTKPNRTAFDSLSCNSVPEMSWQERWSNYKNNKHFSSGNMCNEQGSNEKSTYVRPLHNTFTENFVYKTLQRNKRLQTIVKKLAIERQREKRVHPREAWNNYINELKNRHGYYSNEPITIIPQYVPDEQPPESFDDYYSSSYNWQHDDRNQNLLNEYYQGDGNMQYNEYDIPSPPHKPNYDNDYYCYPTSSQSRLLMMQNRERFNKNNNLNSSHLKRHKNLNPRINKVMTRFKCTKSSDIFKDDIDNSKVAQTKLNQALNHSCIGKVDVGTERVNKVTNEKIQLSSIVAEPRQMCEVTQKYSKLKQSEKLFDNMERKLDVLIESVDVFIAELRKNRLMNQPKNKNQNSESQSICCMINDVANKTTKTKNEIFEKKREFGTSACHLREPSTSKIDRIIEDEMERSEKIKRDIDELLHTKCSKECDTIYDIPTKENCVANSISADTYIQNKLEMIDNTIRSEGRLITIAVNTEPLGLLALLKVSTETLKQFLSYMPALSYRTYLPVLRSPLQQCKERYVCNVCDASFQHPIQLSKHIQNHNLGTQRDCCVCRHVRHLQSNFYGVFDCKYCGESFIRAYCRELHERSCCKRRGYEREPINANLLLLR